MFKHFKVVISQLQKRNISAVNLLYFHLTFSKKELIMVYVYYLALDQMNSGINIRFNQRTIQSIRNVLKSNINR